MVQLKHFNLSEFDSPDAPGSGSQMKEDFLKKLDAARGIANVPFKINSGFRTVAHNKKVGGKSDSAHTKGYACDTAYSSGSEGFKILTGLLAAGFNRIGIAKTYIHADCDPSLPPNVIWTY
jgi:zinc D-Ala-D-Ala carboxypeptidase